jgi:hypothetical protein
MSGHWTTIEALDWLSPSLSAGSLVAATDAVLGSVPQSAASVTPETWIVRVRPAARSPNEHDSVFAVIWQSAAVLVQDTPGRERVVERDALATPRPWFETTIVKAAVSPALIGLSSAVFTTDTSGHRIVTDALDWSEPSLVVWTDAVLFTTPQSAASVGELSGPSGWPWPPCRRTSSRARPR